MLGGGLVHSGFQHVLRKRQAAFGMVVARLKMLVGLVRLFFEDIGFASVQLYYLFGLTHTKWGLAQRFIAGGDEKRLTIPTKPTDEKIGHFCRCRLQIPPIFGSVILPNLPTRAFVCQLRGVTCFPILLSEPPTKNQVDFFLV